MKNQYSITKFATKSQVRNFINDRLFKDAKIKRFSSYNNTAIIFTVVMDKETSLFCPTFASIQSVSYHKDVVTVVFTISNNLYQMGSIISEIEYFRRNPNDALKRNIRVI